MGKSLNNPKQLTHHRFDAGVSGVAGLSIPGAQAARDAQGSDATVEDQVLVLQMLGRLKGLERAGIGIRLQLFSLYLYRFVFKHNIIEFYPYHPCMVYLNTFAIFYH